MKIKQIIKVVSCAFALAGCVSVDSLKAKLGSSDPAEVKEAQEQIYLIVTEGHDKSRFVKVEDNKDRLRYVNIVSDNGLLLKILNDISNHSSYDELFMSTVSRLDFNDPGLGLNILMNYSSLFERICRAEENEFADRSSHWFDGDELKDLSGFPKQVVDSMTDKDLVWVASKASNGFSRVTAFLGLLKRSKDVRVLTAMYNDDEWSGERDHVARALGEVADKISDKSLILKLLTQRKYAKPILNLKQKKVLIGKLPEADAESYALTTIKEEPKYNYVKEGGVESLRAAVMVATISKNKEFVKKLTLELGRGIAGAREYNTYGWRETHDKWMRDLLKELPKMDAELLEEFTALDTRLWPYCIDFIDAEVAYQFLSKGKCNSDAMEEAILRKVPQDKMDARLYVGLKYEATKRSVLAMMSEDAKAEIAKVNETAYREICNKAKAAAKETFELDGFYLGMSYEDAKVVFAHHFPKLELVEKIDGEGKNADYVFYIEGQNNPFCFASVSDGKVYEFNFGKKLLKKWYQFDVQSPVEWAHAYSRATKADMRFKLIEEKTTTMTDDTVWFHQESYQFKHNTKEYLLTYFGEERDMTLRNGLAGSMVREMAASSFRYVRGDQGMLRARIERE